MDEDFIGFLQFLAMVFVVVAGTGVIIGSIIDIDAKPCPSCSCSAEFTESACPPTNVTIINHYCKGSPSGNVTVNWTWTVWNDSSVCDDPFYVCPEEWWAGNKSGVQDK